jgi:hypothetical protein
VPNRWGVKILANHEAPFLLRERVPEGPVAGSRHRADQRLTGKVLFEIGDQ